MIEQDRVISAAPQREEEAYDRAVRPKTLADYVGQPAVKAQLEIFITAARQRRDALDHVLIFGPPGLGEGAAFGQGADRFAAGGADRALDRYSLGTVRIDCKQHCILRDGRPAPLSALEAGLLKHFISMLR